MFFHFRLSRTGSGARLAGSLDEIGQLSLENRPFNLVRVIALAIERRGDLREPRDATRSRQLKCAFHSGHLLVHGAKSYPPFKAQPRQMSTYAPIVSATRSRG